MDLSFYRQRNAIRDWMEYGRSNATPALDEDSDYNDTPIPSALFTSMADENENWDQWADKNIGDTHVGKRKTRVAPSQQQKKKFKRNNDREEEEFRSDDTTPEPSGDDGGRGFDGDDDDEDDTGGSDDGDAGGSGWVRGSGGAGGSSGQVSPLWFTGEINFTHATQDQDHGAPTSQRQTRSGRRARSTPKYAPHLQLPPPYRGRLPPPPLPQQPIHLTFWLPSASTTYSSYFLVTKCVWIVGVYLFKCVYSIFCSPLIFTPSNKCRNNIMNTMRQRMKNENCNVFRLHEFVWICRKFCMEYYVSA